MSTAYRRVANLWACFRSRGRSAAWPILRTLWTSRVLLHLTDLALTCNGARDLNVSVLCARERRFDFCIYPQAMAVKHAPSTVDAASIPCRWYLQDTDNIFSPAVRPAAGIRDCLSSPRE